MPALLTSTSSRPPPISVAVVDQRGAVGVDGHVAADGVHPVAEIGGQRGQPVLPAGRGHDGGAGGVQHPDEPHPEPRRSAGDHGDLAVEAEASERIDVIGDHGRTLRGGMMHGTCHPTPAGGPR